MKRIIFCFLMLWQAAAPRYGRVECDLNLLNDFMLEQNEYNGFLHLHLVEGTLVKINKMPESNISFANFVKNRSGERTALGKLNWKAVVVHAVELVCQLDKDSLTLYFPKSILSESKNLDPEVSQLIDRILAGTLELSPEQKQAIVKDMLRKDTYRMPSDDQAKLLKLCKQEMPDFCWALGQILSHLPHFEKRPKGTRLPTITLSADSFARRIIAPKNLIFLDERKFDKSPGVFEVSDNRTKTLSFADEISTLILSMIFNLFAHLEKTSGGVFHYDGHDFDGTIWIHARKATTAQSNGKVCVKFGLKPIETIPEPEAEVAPAPVVVVEEPKVVAPQIPDEAWNVGLTAVEGDDRPRKPSANGKVEMLRGGIINYIEPSGQRHADKTSATRQLMAGEPLSITMPVKELVQFINNYNNAFKKSPIKLHTHLKADSNTPCTFMGDANGLHVRFENRAKTVINL